MQIQEKLDNITKLIDEVKKENTALGELLTLNYNIAINSYNALAEDKKIDISEQLVIISKILGFNLEDLVLYILRTNNENQNIAPDPQIEEYILSNKSPEKFSEEEYEQFLKKMQDIPDEVGAQNGANNI